MAALRAHQRGGPDNLVVERAPLPHLGEADVLVAIRAAGVTFGELDWDLSWARNGADGSPVIPAHEFSGVVAACGPAARDLCAGDDVFGLVPFDRDGAAAEFVAVPAVNVVGKPAQLTHAAAATIPLAALTSVQALTDRAEVRSGERVLILGASGGVGTVAVQIARGLGAEVIAVGNVADSGLLHLLGADRVLPVDDVTFDEVRGSAEVVVDLIGGHVLRRALGVLKRGGRLITLIGPPPSGLAERAGIEATFFVVQPNHGQLADVARLVERGGLIPVVSRIFDLADGARAYASQHSPRPPGKTVITVPVTA